MTDGQESLAELEALSRQVAEAILEHDMVRLISHNDADGLSAAGIMCNALHRKGILFHATIVSQFDQSTLDLIEKTSYGPVILCDMGSGQVELTSRIKEAIIIDHHKPTGKLEHIQFNPHLVGIDGSTELCASCGAYMIARQMGDNTDLAGLAIAGATGDKQPMKGANKSILDEAIASRTVTSSKGLRIGDGPLAEIFENSIDPYLDITGDKDKIKVFLDSLGIKGELRNLSEEELTKLSSVIILKLVKQGSLPAIDTLIGDNYHLNREVVQNIYDFVNILNACGKDEKAGIALSLCMRDESVIDEAKIIARENQRALISVIKKAQARIKAARSFRYVLLEDSSGTGIIAGTMTRYLYPDKPFLTFNEIEGKIRVSGRGTRKLVGAGLDLAAAMREASAAVGGMGGGHDVASGATIPVGTAMKFIDLVDPIIEKQLKPKA
ncbi:MAG: DHH family phosphoesterase [Candidatus Methanoperedens sp.]|nr:DHH family phosphoesterase [Candidatus Methanoperedens sp.]